MIIMYFLFYFVRTFPVQYVPPARAPLAVFCFFFPSGVSGTKRGTSAAH